MESIPVLHALGGGGGAWDEVLAFGLILGFLVALGAFGYFSGRQRRRRQQRERGRRTSSRGR